MMDALSTPRIPVTDAPGDGRLEEIRRMDPGRAHAAAARELEVVFFAQLIEALRRTLPAGGLFAHTPGSNVYEGWFDRELATTLAAGDPLDLATRLAPATTASRDDHGNAGERLARAGESGATVPAALPAAFRGGSVVAPVAGVVSSPYGVREHPISGARHMHHGIDFAASVGAAVRAVAPGRVVASGWGGGAGRRVVLEHADGYRTVYAHAGRTFIRPNDTVVAGQRIATVGSSGRATGPHLHFEVHRDGVPLDPARVSFTAHAVRRAVALAGAQDERSNDR
jgi:murein DD-endopeptidase MepM/ murein hydrolase activator NlpD